MAKKIVVLISGGGSNLQSLIDASQGKSSLPLHAEIAAVISNNPGVRGLQRAEAAGIPGLVLNHRSFAERETFDRELAAACASFSPDLVILAGFMRILTPAFVSGFCGRLLNIHPSLLPKYPGLHTHRRALEAGDDEHGATVHFVTTELDGGPPILQARVPILFADSVETLAARVLEQEHMIYPTVSQWFVEERLALKDGRAYLDGELLPPTGKLFTEEWLA